ncbi:hypothetical protein [Flavobacterium sp.]|jgi:hypothetical protein|uniref:hypothetical protein n=1 Tax=Flavobacterium sp. TaxID=239 RepID=UPI0022BBAA6F|nr:hypothetical protein [Flavobacterium sp.]MCZ8296211.1 hypothetical protein [Flavobacterium sp.]
MKKVFFSLAFMLIGSFAFANNVKSPSNYENSKIEVVKTKISSVSDLKEILKNENYSISNLKISTNSNGEISCGFSVSYDDGVRSWTDWMDCSEWGSDGLWNLIQFLLYYY